MSNATNTESWFPRCRLAWLERRAQHQGHIGRVELMALFGISTAQASSDLQTYLKLNPTSLTYNTSSKRYEWAVGSVLVINPAPWEALKEYD
jgi:hypothetical protein